jgi:hypothetical protein
MGDIDFSKGGYGGDDIEEMFKPFTTRYMEYWWHFREVLRPGQEQGNPHWSRMGGTPLSDEDWRELIGLSMTNYAVYTGMAEAVSFLEQMRFELIRTTHAAGRLFEVRRTWKAFYSSLYGSFTALSNVICMVIGQKKLFKNTSGTRNYDPGDAHSVLQGIPALETAFGNCLARLEIRNQLDHYWIIWHGVAQGRFVIDRNFTRKAYLVIDPRNEAIVDLDALQKAADDLLGCAIDFNTLFEAMAVSGGYLDQYLAANKWHINYLDYGVPHNGKRPVP